MNFRNRLISSSNRANDDEIVQDVGFTEIQLIAYLEVYDMTRHRTVLISQIIENSRKMFESLLT